MPPKKKVRRAASSPADHGEDPPTPADVDSGRDDLLIDPWTDEQETLLLKSIVRWKPVGIHKHFRMLAIAEHLRNHGYTSASGEHLTVPGIWAKLRTLYNLEALDERENDSNMADVDEKDLKTIAAFEFGLPDDEFRDLVFARRLDSEGSKSPSALSNNLQTESSGRNHRQSTIDDTEDARSSPASVAGQTSVRGTRSKPAGKSQLHSVSVPTTRNRRGKASEEDDVEETEDTKDAKGSTAAQSTTKSKSGRRQSTRRR